MGEGGSKIEEKTKKRSYEEEEEHRVSECLLV